MNRILVPLNKLTEYFVRENKIDTSAQYESVRIPARNLFNANRFDMMAKWLYIDAYEKGMDISWATDIYKDSIRAFSCGKFCEPGTEGKDSFEVYLTEFNELIEDIKENGFDDTKSIIPVGKNDVLLDGAHRVSVAAYYNKSVTIIRFPQLTRDYNYRYFRQYLMSDINMGYMASTYARLNTGCYLACIWPATRGNRLEDISGLIGEVGDIIYEQDIYLTFRGMCNFMAQIYGHQAWTGNIDNHFSGAEGKAKACYNKRYPVHTFLFKADSLDQVVSLKAKIRTLFTLENHSVHISDNDSETIMMTNLLYNPNSVEFMNNADPYKYSCVYNRCKQFEEIVNRNYLDINRFIVSSNCILEKYGLKQVQEVGVASDYVFSDKETSQDVINGIDKYNADLCYHSINVDEMLYNPRNYFYFDGMKFLSLARLAEIMRNRGTEEDLRDLKLINNIEKRHTYIPVRYRYETLEWANEKKHVEKLYGYGEMSFEGLLWYCLKKRLKFMSFMHCALKKRCVLMQTKLIGLLRRFHVLQLRRKLKNQTFSIVSSNCNGGVMCSDLGVPFNSPFVNLFIKASDFVKLCGDFKGYMDEELRFVTEEDPIYGKTEYPTAYLKDVKIYFMHYKSEQEARESWERRRKRINWNNLFFLFTDRSQCTQKDLVAFDKLPFGHKVVFTHVPHPEISCAFYIKGYENEDKVPVLSSYKNEAWSIKRIYDQFDYVEWLNEKR